MRPVRWLALLACCIVVCAQDEVDSEESRKVLGSSVVTSVSVIMDHGNGTKTYLTDAAGQPLDQTEGSVGSPVDLLNPDRYEFYTFDETGDLVKRLMTLDQIKGLLAGGDDTLDGGSSMPTYYHGGLDDTDLEPNMAQGVHSVVANVQNVLRSELKKKKPTTFKPPLSIPDSISSWSMLFPAIISDSSETLDDGNSVNGAIDSGDRLPASSNQENTEVKVSPEVIGKPTAVPPIIHFLEIQSVPSPLKNPTKMPEKTTVEVASTTEVFVTTDRPTSPVNSVEEMSASISSLLSQVTDKQTTTDVGIAEEKKVSSTAMPSSSTESVSKPLGTLSMKTPRPSSKPLLKPESSNVKPVIKKPIQSTTKPHSEIKNANNAESSTVLANNDLKLNSATEHTTTEGNSKQTAIHTSNKEASSPVTKKTTDAVVTFVSTPKPNKLQLSTTEIKGTSTTVPTVVKYQTKPSTPVNTTSTKKTQVKIPATNQTGTALKKPVKPLSVVDKNKNGSDNLEANGSEEVIRIVPNKASQYTPVLNKIKNENSTSINNTSNSAMHTSKPQKKVPIHKPHGVEDTQDCANSKKATSVENKDKLEVAASTSVNEKVKPTKVRTPVLQEVKTVQKPTTYPTVKPAVTKIKPSEQIKITTYKPSTSQPYTTKNSNNKLSSTTERPVNQEKLGSESKIHEVNSSLLDIKENKVIFQTNKTATISTTSPPGINVAEKKVPVHEHGHSASNTEEIKIHSEAVKVPDELTSLSQVKETTTNAANHSKEPECTHGKKPLHTSIQDKISDLSTRDFAASNSEEVKISTVPTAATEIITEQALSKESTTELQGGSTELTTEELQTTTEILEDITTYLPETTTLEMPEMDLVKEGISAVTNILLENKPAIEPQLPIPTLPLLEAASNIVQSPPVKGELKHAASFADFEMTTTELLEENSEKVFSTTSIPLTETELPTTESLLNTNVTVNSNQESTEQVSETSTTPYEETTTEFPDQLQKKETSESNIESIIKNHTLPTKESKLSPEDIEDMAENALPCNHTTHGVHNYTANKTHVNEKTSNTTEKENLEPAQSIISEVNNKNLIEDPSTPALPVETTKAVVKDESLKVDLKPALKTEPPKKAPTRYPVLSNAYRPLQDKPAGTPTAAVELHPAPHESMGLEATTAFLADDVRRFSDLCNELAFRMWTSITGKGSISSRSLVLSPFATTSLLAMVFLGARGPTSGQMNDVLRLDDMVTFNPHQVLQNVTESVLNSRNYGVTTSAFVRELYSDKQKGKILDFYKERAQQYYDGHVEEISFKVIGDILRRRTNLLVKRQTLGKIPEYLRGSNLLLRGPLSGMSANVFQTDCELASAEGRDGEMYFVVRPSTRQRRLVPVPAAVWRTGFLAGYEPGLDATAVALGTDTVVSTILVLPGQQGQVAPGDGLSRLEQRLIETSYRRGGWTRLLRSLLPRPGLELQVPRFSHRSVLNITSTLQRMGLKDLFNENRADLRGLNGLSNDLHLADMVQVNTFSTCGDDTIGARHHIETYPVSPQRMGRDDPELYPRREDIDPEYSRIPLNLRPRQARLPDNPRLRFDRPFLYLVRHNPTGMILYMGRFNPRLLP